MSSVDHRTASISEITPMSTMQPNSAPNPAADGVAKPPRSQKFKKVADGLDGPDLLPPDNVRPLEKFIPVTRFALMDRLTKSKAWPSGEAKTARRFFRYLDYWRHQRYGARLLELEQTYEPFSPDSDLLMTRQFTSAELTRMQGEMIDEMHSILTQANYEQISSEQVEEILSADTHYGLDLHVDFNAFEESMIYYRGASSRKDHRRRFQKFFLKEEFDVPIYKRLFLLFKMKPKEVAVQELMEAENIPRKAAEKKVKKQRAHIPADVSEDNIYMKLFKNIPRSDVEMVFPNTVVKYRLFDKIKLGGGSAVGLGVSIFAAVGKLGAALVNPIAAITLIGGLAAALFRQVMNFVNTKQRYMVIMAQNLYFHSMADNRGVMIKLVDRAAEEDVKEEILLYSVLAKAPANRSDLADIDRAIEKYLATAFGVELDFDLEDALSRLLADGIVTEEPDGTLKTLPPREAAEHLDAMWDVFLDELPDMEDSEGEEIEATTIEAARSALGFQPDAKTTAKHHLESAV
ncbi:MAG: TMEM143 family protein [Pseudomonadota bacterium]